MILLNKKIHIGEEIKVMANVIEKKLYEVLHEIELGVNQFGESIVLEPGERVYIYNHLSWTYPQIKGYDVCIDTEEDWNYFLKEVK